MQITEAEKGLPLVNPIIIIRFYLSVFSSCLQSLKKIDEKKNKMVAASARSSETETLYAKTRTRVEN